MPRKPIEKPFSIAHSRSLRSRIVGSTRRGSGKGMGRGGERRGNHYTGCCTCQCSKQSFLSAAAFRFLCHISQSTAVPAVAHIHTHTQAHTQRQCTHQYTHTCTHIHTHTHTERDSHTLLNWRILTVAAARWQRNTHCPIATPSLLPTCSSLSLSHYPFLSLFELRPVASGFPVAFAGFSLLIWHLICSLDSKWATCN